MKLEIKIWFSNLFNKKENAILVEALLFGIAPKRSKKV